MKISRMLANKIFIESPILKSLGVTHGFFTKNGGCSQELYASLNCKFGNGDAKENVEKNLKIASNSLCVDIANLTLLNQVHSNKVIKANNSIDQLRGDAVLTDTPEHLIAVVTADCVPILLWDDKNKIAAAIHAGWRSAHSGIIENTINEIEKFGSHEIFAAIGPCIRQQNYEVDENFFQLFMEQHSDNQKYFVSSRNLGKFSFDLPKYCYDKLSECGVKNIDDLNIDTYSDSKNFFSCRRAQHKQEQSFGCQISAICSK